MPKVLPVPRVPRVYVALKALPDRKVLRVTQAILVLAAPKVPKAPVV